MTRGAAGRFALVGVVNTAIDVVVFAVLTAAGVGVLAANTVSTSAGMAFSLVANRSFSFRSSVPIRRVVVPFLLVNVVCLWVLHPLVILATAEVLAVSGVPDRIAVVVGKGVAVLVGLVWNYAWYDRVVFAERKPAR